MSPQSLVELTLFSSSAATRSTSLLRCVSTAQRERRTRQSRRTLREGGLVISANILHFFRISFQILFAKKEEKTLSIKHHHLALFHSHRKKTDYPKDKLNCQDRAVLVNQTFMFYFWTCPGHSFSINKVPIQYPFSIHSVQILHSVFIKQ